MDGAAPLIFDGPVLAGQDPRVLQSSALEDVRGSWELAGLPAKEMEWPALKRNADEALDRLAYHAPARGRLLDFGCGWGFFLGAATERGWEPFGLEPLPAHAVHARATFQAQVVTDVLRDDSFAPGSFQAITSFQVFEHLLNPFEDLKRLCSFAEGGAIVLLEVPNIDTLTFRVMRSRHRHFNPDHVNFFSARTLSALVERAGLQVLEVYYPTRYLTLGHLSSYWAQRYLPDPLARQLHQAVTRRQLQSRIVRVNLHDIVAVIGRKPSAIGSPRNSW